MGIGAVIRDFEGFVMAALVKKLDGVFTAREAETKAITISLLWALDVGLNLWCVESDALTNIQVMMRSSFFL